MVFAGSCVQVPKQGLAFPIGDASLEDARWTLPVQLAVAEDVSLDSSRKPSGFGLVYRELSSDEAIKEWDLPVRALVGLGRLRIDFHGLLFGHGGLSDRGGLGPCGGLDRWALFCRRGIVDRGLVQVSGEYVRGDLGLCRRHLRQFVRGLVELPCNVVEFETVEFIFKVIYQFAVRLHFGVVTIRVLHDFVDDEL